MFEMFYKDNLAFSPFTLEHFVALLICISISIYFIYKGLYSWNEKQKSLYITILLASALVFQIIKPIIRIYLGNFDKTTDLPFHLCNILPFIMVFVFIYKWEKVWAILFFWILAGTMQALITPSLKDNFPHYDSIRYWLVHGALTLAAIYGGVVFKWRLDWKDMFLSCIGLNIMALLITPINIALNANYLYLMEKPPGNTIYDLLGPWPWYILSLEIVMLFLFSIILLPFRRKRQ